MAREIKFRAWSKRENMMGEVTGLRFSKSQYPFANVRIRKNGKTVDEGYHFGQEDGSDNVILMQFTGLCDKNGVEIYEGDVVVAFKGEDCEEVNAVCYNANHCKWFLSSPYNNKLPMGLGEFCWLDLEVIGNIHENPELLEGYHA